MHGGAQRSPGEDLKPTFVVKETLQLITHQQACGCKLDASISSFDSTSQYDVVLIELGGFCGLIEAAIA